MTEPDDSLDLVQRARSGDRDAFSALFQRYELAALNLALQITGNRHDAEETVQEAAIHFWNASSNFDPDRNPRALLLHIVARRAVELCRRKRGRSEMKSKVEMQEREATPVDAGAEREELLTALRGGLNHLPEVERQLVALCFGGGLSHREAARVMEMPRQTVTFKVKKAVDGLRQRLLTAGFAASAPLTLDGCLNEAITSGQAFSSGLTQKIMAQIESLPSRSARKITATTASPLLSAKMIAGIVLAAGAFGSAAYWYATDDQLPEPAGNASASSGIEIEEDTPRRWSFAKGIPSDLEVVSGEYGWVRPKGWSAGVLFTPKSAKEEARILLPMKVPQRPSVVAIRFRQGGSLACNWTDGKVLMAKKVYKSKINLDGLRHVFKIYFLGRYAVILVNGTPRAATEYNEAYPARRICVSVMGHQIEEIQWTPLSPADIPDDLAEPQKLTGRFDTMKVWPALPLRGPVSRVSVTSEGNRQAGKEAHP